MSQNKFSLKNEEKNVLKFNSTTLRNKYWLRLDFSQQFSIEKYVKIIIKECAGLVEEKTMQTRNVALSGSRKEWTWPK